MNMMKTLGRVALGLAAAGAAFSAVPAAAGEGHWSVGKGVQCRVILGVVVCSKSRP
jgi:hypothetical protein